MNEFEAANLEDEITEDSNDNNIDGIDNILSNNNIDGIDTNEVDNSDDNDKDYKFESPENMGFDQNEETVELEDGKDKKVEEQVNEEETEPGCNAIKGERV